MDLFGQMDLFGDYPKESPEESRVRVSAECSANGMVSFKYNPLLKKSIRCKGNFLFGHPEVELPAFMKRPEYAAARELAAEWAEHAVRRKTRKNRALVSELVTRFWAVVDQVRADFGEAPVSSFCRIPPIRPKGVYHDLEQVLAAINETYFDGTLNCRITWSNRIGGLSFHSRRRDPLTGEEFHLISISKGYDAANCPLYAVAGVVYHECLHVVIPPVEKNGRRVVHGRAFRQRERRYIYYDEWMKWHREILPKNIRDMHRRKPL